MSLSAKFISIFFILILSFSCQKIKSSKSYREMFYHKEEKIDKLYASRSLSEMEKALNFNITEHLKKLSKNKDRINVFEFGVGHGLVLAEIFSKFDKVYTYGLNKDVRYFTCNKETIAHTAVEKGFFKSIDDVDFNRIPSIYARDTNDGLLPFLEDSFLDLSISQVAIRYIQRKDILLNELLRATKPNGIIGITIYAWEFYDKDMNKVSNWQAVDHFNKRGLKVKWNDIKSYPAIESFIFTKVNDLKIPLKYLPEKSGKQMQYGGVLSAFQLI